MDVVGLLRAFVSVADEESFTGAADLTGTAQPVLSRRVAALERALGGSLLLRGARGVSLTPLGRSVLPQARDVVTRVDYLFESARGQVLEDVRAALPPQADPEVLARLRRWLRGEGVTFTLHDMDVGDREGSLARGGVHLAVLPAPPDQATWRVPLGGATIAGRMRGRRMHLAALRRSEETGWSPPRLLLQCEDDVPQVRDRLVDAALAAGLAAHQVVSGLPTAEALTAVHEQGDVVVCDAREAERHGLEWRELVPPAVRGYRLRLDRNHPSHPVLSAVGADLRSLLGLALGASPQVITGESPR